MLSLSTLDEKKDFQLHTITNDPILEVSAQQLKIQRLKPREYSAQTKIYFNPCSNSINLPLVQLDRILRSSNDMTSDIDELAPNSNEKVR